jgi:hypothetical protein
MFSLLAVILAIWPATAQDVSLEYRIKASFLYNFVKFVEWPATARSGPLTICVAGRNPFGSVLDDTIRGERVNGRSLTARVILEPDASCHVVFVPQGAAVGAYLRAARGLPILTVGEEYRFLDQGGIIAFVVEANHVRFAINSEAAERTQLIVSSRLLQLALPARSSP